MDTETTKAVAKATEAVANTAGKALDILSATGQFANRVIGEAIAQGGGIVSDQIAYWRKMRSLDLEGKFDASCRARGIDPQTMRPLTLAQTVQILEAASLEESDEVQALWAELLANMVDPKSGITFRKLYASLLREFGPVEAALLELLAELKEYRLRRVDREQLTELERELQEICGRKWRKFSETDQIGAIVNLRRLGCIAPDIPRPPSERLLVQYRLAGSSGATPSIGNSSTIYGVEPQNFVKFINWLSDAMMSASGAKATELPKNISFVIPGWGISIGEIAIPELHLALTPLGEDLLKACTRPKAS